MANDYSKPRGLSIDYARQFQDESVADAYDCRPPYPSALFEALIELIPCRAPRTALDIGCGRGEIARELVTRLTRVDAVDFSQPMIERGQRLPAGNHPNLRWICAPVESAELTGPYGLVTAGSSLHWMDWVIVMPKLTKLLSPSAVLAIFDDNVMPAPWDTTMNRIIPRYSTNKDFAPYNLIDELSSRGYFKVLGEKDVRPEAFEQTVEQFIEAAHSRNGFSRQRMSPEIAAEFDRELLKIMQPHTSEGRVHLQVMARIVWGLPLAPPV